MECYILLFCKILLIIIDSNTLSKAQEVDIYVDDSIWIYLEGKLKTYLKVDNYRYAKLN